MNREKLISDTIQLLHRLKFAIDKNESIAWMELNLTIAQLKSLLFISFKGTTNSVKLANALDVTPPNVTGIVNRLVEQKLISREENPEDRRTHILKVTKTGEELLAGLRESGIQSMAEILEHLSDEDLTALSSILASLVRIAERNKDNVKNECD